MIISVLIIPYRTLLDTFLGYLQRNMDLAVLRPLSGHNAKLQCIQRMSGISAGQVCQKIQSILIYRCSVASHSALRVRHGNL